jgi:hypothetical protein
MIVRRRSIACAGRYRLRGWRISWSMTSAGTRSHHRTQLAPVCRIGFVPNRSFRSGERTKDAEARGNRGHRGNAPQRRQAIRKLVKGDFVKVTVLTSPKSFQTLLVRITSIRGSAFRGKLAHKPASPGQSQLPVGTSIAFTTAHIHSAERARTVKNLSVDFVEIQPSSKRSSGTARTKSRSRPTALRLRVPTPPLTTAERIQRIAALGLTINGYVQFMCQAGNPNNASGEATDKAVAAFYEQLVNMESLLGRIHNDFKLE